MEIKAVLFDIDGTLISLDSLVLSIKRTCKQMGLRVLSKKEIYNRIIGFPLVDVFPKIYPKYKHLARCFDFLYHLNYTTYYHPHFLPHVRLVLNELKKRKLKIGYVTTKARITAVYCIKENKMPCDVLVSADDVKHVKPSPEPILKAIKKLRIKKEQTIVVGDHIFDILSGKHAGCKTIGVTTGVKNKKELMKVGANYVINDLAELLKIIDKN